MQKISNIIILAVTVVLSLYLILGAAFLMEGWSALVIAALYVAGGAGIAAGALFFIIKKEALLKTAMCLVACAAAVFTVVVILNFTAGLNRLETDKEKTEALVSLIKGAGGWSMAVYILVQILQVVILPLPAAVCYLPGVAIWDAGMATLLASAGVLIGALICYFLGRLFGRRIVEWIAGKETTEKYANYLGRRGKTLFVIMQILPFFPDDILCMIAGLTKMNFPFFLITMILVRPAIVATYCYLGSGTVIPFEGWGIPVWIAIAVVCVALAVLSFKYGDRIESFLKNLVSKKDKNAQTAEITIAANTAVTTDSTDSANTAVTANTTNTANTADSSESAANGADDG